MNGIIAVNKPKGPTSHDIIDQIRKTTGEKRVGHAGTLDPLASGVLVVAIGRENTKKINEFVKKEKEYLAKIKLGETSSTDDEEGEKHIMANVGTVSRLPDETAVKNVLSEFIGEIEQTPPAYSAIKVKGKKAYAMARKGEAMTLSPRKVFIREIELLKYEWPYLEIRIVCGSGTYVRSLARDLGEKLGLGAYLADLVRTRVGDFTLKNALTLAQIKEK